MQFNHMRYLFVCLILIVLAHCARGADAVEYARDVEPLLATHCYACHGNKEQRSGLRLDSVAAILRGGNRGPAVVAGKSSESRLVQALSGGEDLPRMPLKKPPLSEPQVALIRTWIDQGAKGPAGEKVAVSDGGKSGHWAFQPPVRPALPTPSGASPLMKTWSRNPIDQFILARLQSEGLAPSPEADRVTLIRRLCLDLLGLPPRPAEVDEFLADEPADAYERLVDRLLSSPHYGERWGRHWLDVARYADSNGFNIDAPREIWKYRDWVIDALNRDLPFDQFILEQMAGDLLPAPGDEAAPLERKIATGFQRNTLLNQEGGIDKEQFRMEAVYDRVNTMGVAFLGSISSCSPFLTMPMSRPWRLPRRKRSANATSCGPRSRGWKRS
jgi:hypothetical protein